MMKTEGNDSVYAFESATCDANGLTKREHFAAMAMSSYYGGEFTGQSGMPFNEIAKNCVHMADALITALNNPEL